MSSKKVMIDVRDLGKCYWVGGHQLIDYMGMHAVLERMFRAPAHYFMRHVLKRHSGSHYPPEPGHMKWALRNVSFKVYKGEVLGIVGHNGAGKSVLLKLLSRITRPSEGGARIYGQVSSMLEAGTSFHGELTGRENIRLSGAVLGMRRVDIENRMDEIIEFSEVQEYIDTPVKRYSTGMVLRLGFAVAAHLDTEIMLIDEILAVGDQSFKQRCVAKMRAAVKSGRTVLFVSHDLDILQQISDRAILIRQGGLDMVGSPEEVVARHISTSAHDRRTATTP
jgi:lipopolysaccharide transport system ATP-binding protein